MSDLVLGIDPGGTYTDGALLHYRTRQPVKTTKTLTTRSAKAARLPSFFWDTTRIWFGGSNHVSRLTFHD